VQLVQIPFFGRDDAAAHDEPHERIRRQPAHSRALRMRAGSCAIARALKGGNFP
jgi:hypothetical protein